MNHHVSIPCEHCGGWHRANATCCNAVAHKKAQRFKDNCRKKREALGLPDEGHPEVTQ